MTAKSLALLTLYFGPLLAFERVLGPSLPGDPFLVIWDAKTGRCSSKFRTPIPLTPYGIVHNANETWHGEYMTNLGKIGLYPYIDCKTGQRFNGGLPQLVNISEHIIKARSDIIALVPDSDYGGIGLLDWEEWKPIFSENWDSRKIYQNASINLVKQDHPDWPYDKLYSVAKETFEQAAKKLMLTTMNLAESLRPGGYWGFYEFPTCDNYKYRPGRGYDCGDAQRSRDDSLQWLYNASSALFVSMYLDVATSTNASMKIKYTDLEAMRVDGNRPGDALVPVHMYQVAGNEAEGFLSRETLAETLGQSAALGLAGVIYWGNSHDETTAEICQRLSAYVSETLGPYVKDVIDAARTCSQEKCSGRGRCYVPRSVSLRKGDEYIPTMDSNWRTYEEDMECQCFGKWRGDFCNVMGS